MPYRLGWKMTSPLLPLPNRHPRGGFFPFVGGFSSWRSLSCGALVTITFVVSLVAHSRGDPSLGLSSLHSPDTLCSNSPCLLVVIPRGRPLILELVVNPRVGLLSSMTLRFLVFVFFPRRGSSCSATVRLSVESPS